MNRNPLFMLVSFAVVTMLLVGCGPSSQEIVAMTASIWTPKIPSTNTPELPSMITSEPYSVPQATRDDAGNVTIPRDDVIRIAVFDPTDMYQDVVFVGAALALEDLGPIQGYYIELIEIDDYCAEGAIDLRTAIQSNDPGIFAIIGPACSRPTYAALPILEDMKIVMVSPMATAPQLPAMGPNVFNRVILDEKQKAASGRNESALLQLKSVQEFIGRLGKLGSLSPQNITNYGVFYALSYDAAMVLLQAIQKSAALQDDGTLVINWQDLAQTVRSTQGYEGVTGSITLDEHGNRVP